MHKKEQKNKQQNTKAIKTTGAHKTTTKRKNASK